MTSEIESAVCGRRVRKISDRQKSFLSIEIHLKASRSDALERVYPTRALNPGA
jgi:hypothetical protein